MDELFVSYELALKLKEKGFNLNCFRYWNITPFFKVPSLYGSSLDGYSNPYARIISAPTYQQVTDWFRDVHKIHICADFLPNTKQYATTFVPIYFTPKEFDTYKAYHRQRSEYSTTEKFDKYYDALASSIEEALKLI